MKRTLSTGQIINMNAGFFGIQFSFGLQQSNMSPIYSYLGADEASMPLLWLAGPMTGLIVQPLIGALSDKTESRWGRRSPYFLIGAILCSLGLLAMPFSSTLWMAASLLWILDAANNVTMEPYRAYVNDRLPADQRSVGFLTQSAFTGLGQTLAYLTPSILIVLGMSSNSVASNNIPHITIAAFLIGAVFSLFSILWSLKTTPEESSIGLIPKSAHNASNVIHDVWDAFKQMPHNMKQLAWMKLFQWYALFCYWQYIALSIGRTVFNTTDPNTEGFREAVLLTGQMGALYNLIAFLSAFLLIPIVKRLGPSVSHAICLSAAGIGMMVIPNTSSQAIIFTSMVGIGLAWASIMGNPYVMLADCIPEEKSGVYMGIFNMFIVIPMIIQIFTLPFYYDSLLGSKPQHVILLAGGLMMIAALLSLRIKSKTV